MTNRMHDNPRLIRAGAMAACVVAALAAQGCGKKKAPPPPPPPPPPRVEAPPPVRVEGLASDPRVQFPQAAAPTDESLARAVAGFATALAKGDHAALAGMLDAPARGVLESQVGSGEWKSATEGIRAVRVVRLVGGGESADLGLAVQDSGGAYLTGWRAMRVDDRWAFTGLPVAARSAPTAADLDNADLSPPITEKKEEPAKPVAKPAEQPAEPPPTQAQPGGRPSIGSRE